MILFLMHIERTTSSTSLVLAMLEEEMEEPLTSLQRHVLLMLRTLGIPVQDLKIPAMATVLQLLLILDVKECSNESYSFSFFFVVFLWRFYLNTIQS